MPWLQLRMNCNPDNASRLEAATEQSGAQAVTLEDNADQPIFEPEIGEVPLWSDTRLTALFSAETSTQDVESQLKQALKKDLPTLSWHILEDKDWEREWMQHYHPIECSEDFWICPSWISPPNASAINLLLDPGLAFGTGTHPTTYLCLKWLAQTYGKNGAESLSKKHVIDYGCGSGILGIACLLLGAPHVLGIDIDPQALMATQDNVERNHLDKQRFDVRFPKKDDKHQADLILANILAGPLVELAPTLIGKLNPGGTLCLSGILSSQTETVCKHYESSLSIQHRFEHEGWACIIATQR